MFEGSDVFASPALSYYKLNSSAEFMENNKNFFMKIKQTFLAHQNMKSSILLIYEEASLKKS